jgi:hypothetical protein
VRVLVSSGVELSAAGREMAAALAGDTGRTLFLSRMGVGNLRRRLSQTEVGSVREALGRGTDCAGADAGDEEPLVAYVCSGRLLESAREAGGGGVENDARLTLAPVSDHVNLTWLSPLRGPNDEALGPRFPSVAGVYRPDLVQPVLGELGLFVNPSVVVQVGDQARLTAFEWAVARRHGIIWASDELAPVVLLAAHMGMRVGAIVIDTGVAVDERIGDG